MINYPLMHLHFQDHTTIGSLQKAFTDSFPYLKMEFFSAPHRKYEFSAERNRLLPDQSLRSVKRTHSDVIVEISCHEKVSAVEEEIALRTGLSIQILRKEKEGWVQSTGEDDLTLKELNLLGRNSSDEFILEEEDIDPQEEKPEKFL